MHLVKLLVSQSKHTYNNFVEHMVRYPSLILKDYAQLIEGSTGFAKVVHAKYQTSIASEFKPMAAPLCLSSSSCMLLAILSSPPARRL
jgi:hypothetical protein